MNIRMTGHSHYLRRQPHIHNEREEAWCFQVDLQRALDALPPDLLFLYHLIEEGYRDREIARRMSIRPDEVTAYRASLASYLKTELGEA